MNKKVTAMDVARLAGVSQSSVSRAFSKSASISNKKRKMILDAAEKLGYQPNAIARGLITNQSRIIGIVMRDVQNPFYPEVLEKFYSRLSEEGYQIMFINSQNDEVQEYEVSQLIEYSVEGVIITDALLTSAAVQKFNRNGISVVLFNRYISDSMSNAVICNNFSAGQRIGQYLLDTGHRQLGFISGPSNTSTSLERSRGFIDTLQKHGIESIPMEDGGFTYEGGFAAAEKLMKHHAKIDALFCANDVMAFGAMDYLNTAGYRIPEDISVIGFDNVKMADWSPYALTTWQQPVDEMIQQAVKLMLDDINGQQEEPEMNFVDGCLIERASVKNRR
ncbi:LacI family DNA-binding transcriptional regulator [Fictibacillus fluitans]|uniref:LacI family DNA-binding transcriptional regulator n=1 Tax=Fictibacillus fluitans TaxID=3058422 RepID=A0ABT8HVY0_9BACL|nr:LacI family DNA-binding transcriptional regulator [Fictibacillus sp. NE201]MDN4524935.1 LacI family DNA-binding transcriptional regulator [Fictibacillus sp. NE201]